MSCVCRCARASAAFSSAGSCLPCTAKVAVCLGTCMSDFTGMACLSCLAGLGSCCCCAAYECGTPPAFPLSRFPAAPLAQKCSDWPGSLTNDRLCGTDFYDQDYCEYYC
jgi:hypothetical protein